MISEKTVELNLTTEMVNCTYSVTKQRPYILAPSQTAEATLGFDVSVGTLTGVPCLIQYKRAEYKKRKNEYVYHLNKTSKQDQHLRLYTLELMGWNVYYALPIFYTIDEVIINRQRLLPMTIYIKPSSMIPIGGNMSGKHKVVYNPSANTINIHSEEGSEINERFDFNDIINVINTTEKSSEIMNRFLKDFNQVFSNDEPFQLNEIIIEPQVKNDKRLFNGMSVIAI